MKDLSSAQRRDKQNIRIHENSKPPLINKLINQPPIQEGRQSVIFDEGEEGLLNIDRRVLIDDEFYQEKSSVFNRLGSKVNTRTYSQVLGKQGEYVQQPCGHKRINPDLLGPSKRTNNSQVTNTNVKASSSNTPRHHSVQQVHYSTTQARALLSTLTSTNATVNISHPSRIPSINDGSSAAESHASKNSF